MCCLLNDWSRKETMNKNYIPQPVDTTDVQLPEELSDLVEQMAKNVHEVWAQSRIEQGWTWGAERSDALKQHPCLVAIRGSS